MHGHAAEAPTSDRRGSGAAGASAGPSRVMTTTGFVLSPTALEGASEEEVSLVSRLAAAARRAQPLRRGADRQRGGSRAGGAAARAGGFADRSARQAAARSARGVRAVRGRRAHLARGREHHRRARGYGANTPASRQEK